MTLSDYGLIVSIVAGFTSTILSIIALNISHKTFQQQKTFENENHYYEYKFDTYVETLRMMGEYLFDVQSILYLTINKVKSNTITREDGYKSANEIDECANKLQNNLEQLKNFIPNAVIGKIDNVLDIIFNGGISEEDSEDELKKAEKHFKVLADAMGDVEKVMIQDLGLDNIHKRLSNRTREFRKKKTTK